VAGGWLLSISRTGVPVNTAGRRGLYLFPRYAGSAGGGGRQIS